MADEIISTFDLMEDGAHDNGPAYPRTDMVATEKPTGGIEFHVSMHDYTMGDMEDLIVNAAATKIIGKFSDGRLAKMIEEKCIAMIDAKAREALDKLTTEIIDQPLIPSYGDKKPVTMREFIGLTGREYLAEMVGKNDGKKGGDSWRSENIPRIQYLVSHVMERKFQEDMTKATNAVLVAMQREIKAELDKALSSEKARLSAALAKTVAP